MIDAVTDADRARRARALVRRQMVLTAATLLLVAGALVLLHWHQTATTHVHYARVTVNGRPLVRIVHDGPGPMAVRLAVAQLVLCGALAAVAVVHAARVIAFVFPGVSREVS